MIRKTQQQRQQATVALTGITGPHEMRASRLGYREGKKLKISRRCRRPRAEPERHGRPQIFSPPLSGRSSAGHLCTAACCPIPLVSSRRPRLPALGLRAAGTRGQSEWPAVPGGPACRLQWRFPGRSMVTADWRRGQASS